MQYNFYWNKTIDDANIWCDRVIVSDCDNNHSYKSFCELLEDCPSVNQLTKNCVIDALNDLAKLWKDKWIPSSKWFLKATTNWCLTIADPTEWMDSDRNVAVSEKDNNPWPLDTKVKWSCSYDWLYCIDIEEAWPSLLVWRPSGPNGPFINPSLPSGKCTNWWNVKLKNENNEWFVDYECSWEQLPNQYCKCIFTGWIAATPCINWSSTASEREWRTVRYFLPHDASQNKPRDTWTISDSNSYITWDWVCKWTEVFWAPEDFWVIMIKEPWVYAISYSAYITTYQTCHSIRCWLYIKWDDDVIREINDTKYQCWEYPTYAWKSWRTPALNRMFPDQYDYNTWNHYTNTWWTLDNTWLPFGRTYLVNLTSRNIEIYMAVKPDMRDQDPRLIQANDEKWRYYIWVTWSNSDDNSASTSIEIVRISDPIPNGRMKNITIN